jgi:DNA-binding response OmpR family regulator
MLQVLVVDDDQGTRETWGVTLRHAGYDVHLADSGSAAIVTLSTSAEMHALLLDLNLGDITGYDVLRWMRDQSVVVPTAVMTAFRTAFDPDEAIALGAMTYVDQPLSIDDILALADSLTAPPSPHDDPLRLHTCFLAGQPHALDCLASVFLKALPRRLRRAFPGVPWDFTLDAATDACLEYAANPARFDRSRNASIVDFVYLIARRNLANRVRAEIALKHREVRYAEEQMAFLHPRLPIRGSDINLCAAMSTLTTDPRERRAAELWLDDAGNDAIAEALGVGHWAQEDRRREAKRFKDRLLKRLSRYFRPFPDRA